MATIAFPEQSKTVKLSSSTTYTYLYIPAEGSNPTLLLLHGFPSSSYDWRRQIEYFPTKGFGVLAPDLLGYGGTDKPSSLSGYNGKRMASDLVELLEHENIENVHVIGHDWGCFPASRLANYFPKRFLTVTFLDIPYRAPGQMFDLDAVNKTTKELMGFERFGYWYFFNKEEAGKLCAENFESFFSLMHPEDPATWAQYFGPTGATEEWVRSNRVGPLAKYWTEEEKLIHREIFKGGYDGGMDWYRARILNVGLEEEKGLDPNLPQPVLMVVAKRDPIGDPKFAESMKQFVGDLTWKEVDAGHWLQLEKSEEVNRILEEFFNANERN